ncbi:hypothetical protein LX15_001229 [Streptoalloteichus tenebrarius]|uniref:GNAT family N-acetyltransferase n=1 Tax=Streptoalloteichus tenebrarius (strain ATCC 17920 / DSM 40477 / JCM 4838 / CBS 697.72 / NBRC 16177 / NCIMB 11028 / NRRL B-12390 / A12253. 1 / ISP 5477) TaxID=1933 RepID=A0ABT1HPU9_STRSD|nr:hypothetical protein [Streptoalloteichus tenebrarius]MCP2257544.1 hypothetical protein [Streptoalloteichus tenebrarius]BFE98495.1 hypothetical protein GCM10020241_01710 [Streptoalloteichus tenebrarius]
MASRQVGATPDDLGRLQALARRLWSPDRRFHVDDLVWGWHSVPGAAATFRTAFWQDGEAVLAGAWVEPPGHLELLADPGAADLLPEVLDWFDSVAAGRDRSCLVMEGDVQERGALRDGGYRPQEGGPFFPRHAHDLVALPEASLPDGFTITHVTRDDADRRVAAHRAGWSDFGSHVTGESHRRVMACPPYRTATDLVVVSPGGEGVASALGWAGTTRPPGPAWSSPSPVLPRSGAAAWPGRSTSPS